MQTKTKLVIAVFAALFLAYAGPAGAAGDDPEEAAEEKYRDAVVAVKNLKYRRAIGLLQDVLEEDSRNADALNYMGYSHRKLGQIKPALTYYRRALNVEPDHKGANEYIGEAYLELKQFGKARIHLDRLARICGPSCEEYQDLKKAFVTFLASEKQS
ncbi:MAG: tetratricopeptide repeat protein [Alphaproteobacteria bacterium]